MSFEVVLSRVAGMSAAGLWAIAAILVIVFLGAWLIYRLHLAKRKDGERFRLKLPFFEIETGRRPRRRRSEAGVTPGSLAKQTITA